MIVSGLKPRSVMVEYRCLGPEDGGSKISEMLVPTATLHVNNLEDLGLNQTIAV
jgi:hypothetical protein